MLNTSLMRQEFTSPNLLKRLPGAPRFFHLSSQQGGRGGLSEAEVLLTISGFPRSATWRWMDKVMLKQKKDWNHIHRVHMKCKDSSYIWIFTTSIIQSLSYSLLGTTGALIVMNDDIVYRSAGSHFFGIFILFLFLGQQQQQTAKKTEQSRARTEHVQSVSLPAGHHF